MRSTHLAQLVPAAAERDAGGSAVRAAGEELDWATLATLVDGAAVALAGAGVRRGDRVAILLRRSAESTVAVHAALAAGAIAVPLDPLAPAEWVRRLLADCEVRVVLADDHALPVLEAALAGATSVRALIGPSRGTAMVPTVPWTETAAAGPFPRPRLLGDDPAYVIYTSGSTGSPKGILHTHRSGLRYAELAAATYDLRPADRVAGIPPLHVDQSTFELYAAPLAGACSIVVPEVHLRMPASLTALLAEERATVWYSVPSLLVSALHRGALDQRDLTSLRWVLFGGEVVPAGPLRALMERWPQARFSNVYGPAEVNHCTHHHLPGPPSGDHPIPIGRPWDDTEVLVVDEDLEPVPPGAAGQLLVRTATAMRGYWGRPDPFLVRTGPSGLPERWYPTGDLVQERSDGELVFLGRADNQVKVRGHRIELEAVEAALGDLAGVEEAVAAVVPGDGGEDELVAVVVPSPGAEIDSAGLRRQLARVLPAHAVPPRIVELGAGFARMTGGKIDRRSVRASLRAGSAPGPVQPEESLT